jgi:hypothetical protein
MPSWADLSDKREGPEPPRSIGPGESFSPPEEEVERQPDDHNHQKLRTAKKNPIIDSVAEKTSKRPGGFRRGVSTKD